MMDSKAWNIDLQQNERDLLYYTKKLYLVESELRQANVCYFQVHISKEWKTRSSMLLKSSRSIRAWSYRD